MLPSPSIETSLTECGAQFTPLELRLPESLAEQQWADIGRKLLRADQVMQWWIGDWAAFGAGNPDKDGWRKAGALREFCKANGFRVETAADHAWVSRSVHLSLRKDSIAWSFYKEVAPLKPKDQMRWLKVAEDESLSVSELRKKIRMSCGESLALESEGRSVEIGTKYYDDFFEWLKRRPDGFWTDTRVEIWRGRIQEMRDFVDSHAAVLSGN